MRPESPTPEPALLHLRAYCQRVGKRPGEGFTRPKPLEPGNLVLVFDTETRIDPDQALRFGAYQMRSEGRLVARGYFTSDAPATLSDEEMDLLRQVVAEENARLEGETPLELLSRTAFVRDVLFKTWRAGGRIVGFNLPFDLSRLAIEHTFAKGRMKGGFSFKLLDDERGPRVRVKSVSRALAFMDFAGPGATDDRDHPPEPGFFVDVRTLAHAIKGRLHSLASLSRDLNLPEPKGEAQHGRLLDRDYIAYAMRDVEVTWSCYDRLSREYAQYGVATPTHELYSSASLGKAHLDAMEVKPWRESQPDFPPETIGRIMSAYFGGRAEVRLRRTPVRVALCDFVSMYPTVSTLMGLWEVLTAKGVATADATEDVTRFVDTVDLDDLRKPETWRNLLILVQVKPEDDLFPVRTRYAGKGQPASIGLNHLTAEGPLWFTLADVLVSKILTGKAPTILQAIRFTQLERQDGLQPITLFGDERLKIDPAKDDFFRRVIQQRQSLPSEEPNRQALKILANATSYGVFVELRVDDLKKRERIELHYGADAPREIVTDAVETPGRFFHPLLGAAITGAARLMLALAERLCLDEGLDWAFCDTDSIAIANPANLPEDVFQARVKRVVAWFEGLDPYQEGDDRKSILKIEDVNWVKGRKGEWAPVRCFAISAKRYALFTQGDDGAITIVKATRHGLGHLMAPYQNPSDDDQIHAINVAAWQRDYWAEIIRAALTDMPGEIDWGRLPGFNTLAASRYTASRRELLDWFERYNKGRPYGERIKPFNFLLSLQARTRLQRDVLDNEVGLEEDRGDRPRCAAPFLRNLDEAAEKAFDRRTGEPVARGELQTLEEALEDFHLHSESKFLGGDGVGPVALARRHLQAIAPKLIGKEADDLDVAEFLQEEEPGLEFEFGEGEGLRAFVLGALRRHSAAAIARQAKMRDDAFTALKRGEPVEAKDLERAFYAIQALDEYAPKAALQRLEECVKKNGLTATARALGEDPSNLSKLISGKRSISERLRGLIAQLP